MRKSIFAALALSLSLFALSGCKSPAEKACANMIEHNEKFGSDDEIDEKECVEMLDERKGECENGDEVLECMADIDADDEEELGKQVRECSKKCEKK